MYGSPVAVGAWRVVWVCLASGVGVPGVGVPGEWRVGAWRVAMGVCLASGTPGTLVVL